MFDLHFIVLLYKSIKNFIPKQCNFWKTLFASVGHHLTYHFNLPNVRFQSPSFKISRKASSSYSLKLEPPNKQKVKPRRKPLSTPASPNRSKEPICTCMTPEQFARLRSQDPRYRSSCGTTLKKLFHKICRLGNVQILGQFSFDIFYRANKNI